MPSLRDQSTLGPVFGQGVTRPFSRETPVPCGPRKAGQSLPLGACANAGGAEEVQLANNIASVNDNRMVKLAKGKRVASRLTGRAVLFRIAQLRFDLADLLDAPRMPARFK